MKGNFPCACRQFTRSLEYKLHFIHSTDSEAPEAVVVSGFYIEGAKWDLAENHLTEQLPRVLIEKMPDILFKVSHQKHNLFSVINSVNTLQPILMKNLIENSRYKCPAYKTSERRGLITTSGHSTNFILDILLESRKPNKHWIKRSVALVCQTIE